MTLERLGCSCLAGDRQSCDDPNDSAASAKVCLVHSSASVTRLSLKMRCSALRNDRHDDSLPGIFPMTDWACRDVLRNPLQLPAVRKALQQMLPMLG